MQIERRIKASQEKKHYLEKLVREELITDRFLNFGKLTKLAKCVGIVGPRGSGKSLAATAMTIVDYLIPGYSVWSNMAIQWGLTIGDYVVGYKSGLLDKANVLDLSVGKGMVLVDEINIEYSEARRSMTNRNLSFNKLLQQLRKKELNLIYTAQHEMWIDTRLRWQTDIFIKCQDVCLKPGGIYLPYDYGEYSEWKVYDMSGFLGKGAYQETQAPVATVRFNGRQWWKAFNTLEVQGEDESDYGHPDYKEPKYNEEYLYLDRVMTGVIDELVDLGTLEYSEEKLLEEITANSTVDIYGTDKEDYILKTLKKKFNRPHYRYDNGQKIYKLNHLFRLGSEA